MDHATLSEEQVGPLVRAALEEDLGEGGDLTSMLVIPPGRRAEGRIFARREGVVAGLPLAAAVFREVDGEIQVDCVLADGDRVAPGGDLLRLRGPARGILAGERTALNFLARLSGVATMTRRCVDLARPFGAAILDTRKTTPGLRLLEKYAVAVGGGVNHRRGLFDQVLLKENHFALAGAGEGGEGYRRTVARAVQGGRPVEAEARNREQALAAIEGGAAIILLDNMAAGEMKTAVTAGRELAGRLGRRVLFEASGGIGPENLADLAATGVDRISLGALTHSVRPLDLSLLLEPPA